MKKTVVTEPEEEDSYVRAKAGFELFGEPLRPYSASRKVAAQSMGTLYPMIGEEGAAQFARTSAYPGMLNDIMCVLWLCSLPDPHQLSLDEVRSGAWTPTLAFRKPHEAASAALEWAEKKGMVDMMGEPFAEAAKTFMSIVSPVEDAKFQVQTNGPKGGAEDSGKV